MATETKLIETHAISSIHSQRIEIGVQDVSVEYGAFVKLGSNTEIKDDDLSSKEEELIQSPDVTTAAPDQGGVTLFQAKTVYPGFHTYSTIGYMIVCTTFVVTMFDVTRQWRNMRKQKAAYAALPTENHH